MKLKSKLFKENHREVFVTNEDENIKAAKQELLEMIVEHLPMHFPDKFESKEGGIHNKISKFPIKFQFYLPIPNLHLICAQFS